MAYIHQSNEWGLIIPSVAAGTRPAAAYGTSVTPGTNAYGTYTEIMSGATLTDHAYEIWININSVRVAGAAHSSMVMIGVDNAGGSTYVDLIPDLVGGPAGDYAGSNGQGGVWYRFPVFIRAGSSIAAKGSRSVGTTAFNIHCIVYCRPSRPELVRAGSFVRAYGSALASSQGTSVTPGGAAEGTYVELGTFAEPIWYLETGVGIDNATIGLNAYACDLAVGDATNKKVAVQDLLIATNTAEELRKDPVGGRYIMGAVGDKVYGRAQAGPLATVTGFTMAAYGVGG